jgi:hypothetical protein
LNLIAINDDDDDDLQWVRALTVPRYLGLIDRPFVSHNLISASGEPCAFTKVPDGLPRLKILISSGFKKEPIYVYYPYLSKSEYLPGSQRGLYGERDTCL